MFRTRVYGLLLFLALLAGCATVPQKPASPPPIFSRFSSLLRVDPHEVTLFEDDLDTDSLRTAALQSRAYFLGLPDNQLFILGKDTYTVEDMAASMTALVQLLDGFADPKGWVPALCNSFAVYQSVGTDPERTVVFSSYYEPSIPVRQARDASYRYPLYARPNDLVSVDLGLFDETWQGARLSGHVQGRALAPYPTRADIDSGGILKNKGLELAWAKNPLDVLDLQIEGSGWLDYGDSEPVRIRYDGDNGHRYKSVGQYLIASKRISAKRFSRAAFRRYMERHSKERQKLLNVNDRYIFFRIDKSSAAPFAYGNIDVPLTPGRSIATDPKIFPKGILAYIDTERAIVDGKDRVKGQRPLKRFMLNQDEGGAIQGPGRVDIFAGHGDEAKELATHLWYKGKLYFLVKKKS